AEADGAEPTEVYNCDLVAINTFSAQVFEAYAVADRLRKAGVRVAMGGLHVTVLPEEALEHADYVFLGEGENVWPAAVNAIAQELAEDSLRASSGSNHTSGARALPSNGRSQRVWRSSDFPPIDLRKLPTPRYDLLAGRSYSRFPVQTSRGCPWRCDFCA